MAASKDPASMVTTSDICLRKSALKIRCPDCLEDHHPRNHAANSGLESDGPPSSDSEQIHAAPGHLSRKAKLSAEIPSKERRSFERSVIQLEARNPKFKSPLQLKTQILGEL